MALNLLVIFPRQSQVLVIPGFCLYLGSQIHRRPPSFAFINPFTPFSPMKKILHLSTLLLLGWCLSLAGMQQAWASHAQAGQLSYQYVSTAANGDQTYTVRVEFYRDCSGIPAPTSFLLTAQNTCAGTGRTVTPQPGRLARYWLALLRQRAGHGRVPPRHLGPAQCSGQLCHLYVPEHHRAAPGGRVDSERGGKRPSVRYEPVFGRYVAPRSPAQLADYARGRWYARCGAQQLAYVLPISTCPCRSCT